MSGRLQYFVTIPPYVILIVLGVRGWLLPGAQFGIKYYTMPNFDKLMNVQCWIDAARNCFKHI